MAQKAKCYLLCGNDTYRSYKALKSIELRFLKQQNSLADFVTYDLEETSLDTLKQALLTVPFLVSHRLFVLKHTFAASKATLDGIQSLLPLISPATVIVFYEAKLPDKRLGLYKWLTAHAAVQDFTIPTGLALERWITELAREQNVTFASGVASRLALYYGNDSWRLSLEIQKLASAALARGDAVVTMSDVEQLCDRVNEESLFKLTDAIRDGKLKEAVTLYQSFILKEDPMYLAATIASQVRTFAKLYLCQTQGVTRPDEIARQSGLNPYVVKLSLPMARGLSKGALVRSYRELIRFDASVKDGSVPPELGLLLLIVRLHDTLKVR